MMVFTHHTPSKSYRPALTLTLNFLLYTGTILVYGIKIIHIYQ